MRNISLVISITVGCLLLSCGLSSAEKAPQDNWYLEAVVIGGIDSAIEKIIDIDFGPDGNLYVLDEQKRKVVVFSADATSVTNWSLPSKPEEMAVHTNGIVYVLDEDDHHVYFYSPAGQNLGDWSAFGNRAIAIAENGEVYIAHKDGLISIYSPSGTLVRSFGQTGNGPGEFNQPQSMDFGLHGYLYVADDNNTGIQVVNIAGIHVAYLNFDGNPISVGPRGTVAIRGKVYNSNEEQVANIEPSMLPGSGLVLDGSAISPDGQTFCTYKGYPSILYFLRRAYRTYPSSNSVSLPIPYVQSVSQRPGTTYVDVDYIVYDQDDSNVNVGVIGFVGGETNLGSVVKLSTLVEGTASNVGSGISAGSTHRITWNAGADWTTNSSTIRVKVLAKDSRALLGFDYITIPSNGPNPELTINRIPISEYDFLSCWYWLLSTNDTSIANEADTIIGVGGAYDGETLYSDSTTTAPGIQYLLDRHSVRRATPVEVLRAQEATTPGSITQWTPTRQVGMRPVKINELGIETSITNGVWVVPIP